ncbi:MAG: undecaprenyl-diphosphate phosphatase [Planctomycetes bacterium]|nr:undecaprenyl-diphosphate phosphatase [Planctomycetota bacterium]
MQLVGPGVLGAVVLGIVEGLTEFLPVSSTGHLVVANRLLGNEDPTFEVAIQAGAITAIAVLYRQRLVRALMGIVRGGAGLATNLLTLIAVAALPATVLGLLADDWLDAHLFRPAVVAATTILGGLLLIVLERWLARRGDRAMRSLDSLTLRDAVTVGAMQCLALVPGTSRSASTIAGGLLAGLSRSAAAEFSFLVGLPILYGACALKLWKSREALRGEYLVDLGIGAAASFVTAILVVLPFVRFLQKHTFLPFAYYRIVAGIALLALIFSGVLRA